MNEKWKKKENKEEESRSSIEKREPKNKKRNLEWIPKTKEPFRITMAKTFKKLF